ncbi:Uncharacterised protein [Vibrio cholerae]|nr:Uncharacterised protein [Vibrio cholerae]CSI65110.1 Uncharacterised protein [Vibrio cholerae]
MTSENGKTEVKLAFIDRILVFKASTINVLATRS